jgi:large subunit ribosomal protein L2
MKKIGMRKSGGRNNRGRITVRHRGGGQKRLMRELDYREGSHQIEMSGKIVGIAYDPNRTAYLGECEGYNKRKSYKILGGEEGKEKLGKEIKVVKLKEVGVGEEVYKVSLRAGEEGKVARAAGARSKIVKQGGKVTIIRMPSGEIGKVNAESTCYIGVVEGKEQVRKGKAGVNRRLGIRPTVRGVAMNPIDHPNGGKTPGGQPKTP